MSDDRPLPHVDERDVLAFARDNVERYEILSDSEAFTPTERGAARRLLALWTLIHARFDTVTPVATRANAR